jgi:hypothetical protein
MQLQKSSSSDTTPDGVDVGTKPSEITTPSGTRKKANMATRETNS